MVKRDFELIDDDSKRDYQDLISLETAILLAITIAFVVAIIYAIKRMFF